MFERFTQAARDAVVRAQTEARSLDHGHIGTEHLLLALLGSGLAVPGLTYERVRAEVRDRVRVTPDVQPDRDEADAAALRAIGIDLDQVRRAIEENFGVGALHLPRPAPKKSWWRRASGHVPFTPRAKKVLELSLREAIRLKQNFIAPEHIMLGVLREDGGLAALIMADAGVEPAVVRGELERALSARAA
ncbi:Clp protease N-terminal domain-containing protein [Spirilliplanes yamanashiensis]|uniref:Clp protease n=1 Tax=Spirilliplanes yamanashiensis TaxID=42233 RepID=A0A8J3YC64_9ACTN|nr:Clp protease N-terminal domain-containing protein [Spirilliplanes yamanashiensis]MDP9818744.1 ATP-dependent Clp protease ATP-binding subunit ClpA [Spirilliplanes yamanashiensis]GIJ05199.1 Clp protease [Spirilliplanes yamanashiensis]